MSKYWTNICENILSRCDKQMDCTCWMDYCIWSKDNPKLDFEEWKSLVKIEYEESEI